MGFFSELFQKTVIEWDEYRDDVIFWKHPNKEIKKRSLLVIKPGQDAVFLADGKLEGIFTAEGTYEMRSQVLPRLRTLAGYRGNKIRAEVIFINTKEFTMTWGTKNAVQVPFPGFPAGIPVRAFGTYSLGIGSDIEDTVAMLDILAGVKAMYTVEDVRLKVDSMLDQLLMKWIMQEGKDVVSLQSRSQQIAKGIEEDIDYQLRLMGMKVSNFKVSSFSYPKEIQDRINQAAAEGLLSGTAYGRRRETGGGY